jgi:hypothetical protein
MVEGPRLSRRLERSVGLWGILWGVSVTFGGQAMGHDRYRAVHTYSRRGPV